MDKKLKRLDLEKLRDELIGYSMPEYAIKRMLGEIQNKINELVEYLNAKE